MIKRCRFGIRVNLPFGMFPNAGVIVVHLPADIVARVSEAITLIKLNGGVDAQRIVWEAQA